MPLSSALPAASPQTPPLTLRERLQLVPPARIIAAEEDSGEVLTLGDLRQFSSYLAEEFDYTAAMAAGYPAGWYAGQIDDCTPKQAETLRTMVIELCEQASLNRGYLQGMLTGGIRRAEALDAFGATMAVLILLLLIPLLVPDRPEVQPVKQPKAARVQSAVQPAARAVGK